MSRLFSTLLVFGLLGGTAAAFAVTEGLKLERTPISGTRVDKVFSPVCGCPRRAAAIGFRLRKADALTVEIVEGNEVVRTLVDSRRFGRGLVHFTWDGRDDAGRVVRDGAYRPRVHLDRRHRTIVLPNPIRVDTAPPHIRVVALRPAVFSPDGDGRADGIVVRYRVSEPAHALLLVDGRRRVRGRFQRLTGELRWYGKVGGKALPSGAHRITLAAEDLAGNSSRPTRAVAVRIRYVALARHAIRARAGTRFGVRVSTDAKSFRWRLGKRSGEARPGLLVVRASGPGRTALVVQANGHADRAVVIVDPRP